MTTQIHSSMTYNDLKKKKEEEEEEDSPEQANGNVSLLRNLLVTNMLSRDFLNHLGFN